MNLGFLHDARRSNRLHRFRSVVPSLLFELVGALLRLAQLGFFLFDLSEFLSFLGINFRRILHRLRQTSLLFLVFVSFDFGSQNVVFFVLCLVNHRLVSLPVMAFAVSSHHSNLSF